MNPETEPESTPQPDKPLSSKQLKHQRRLERHQTRHQQQQRRRLSRRAVYTGGAVVLAAAVVGLIWFIPKPATPGTHFTDQGRQHIAATDVHVPYNSNPPTSGPHAAALPWGVKGSEQIDEHMIHNLEHGGIEITYKPSLSESDLAKLTNFANGLPTVGATNIVPIILAPRAKDSALISVTAWTWKQDFDNVDIAAIKKFWDDHVGKGPEPVQ